MAIDPIVQNLRSPLNVRFLDDGTLAGPTATVNADLSTLIPGLQRIGLSVNHHKCEVTSLDDVSLTDNSIPLLPNARPTPLTSLSLLGAPIHPDGLREA